MLNDQKQYNHDYYYDYDYETTTPYYYYKIMPDIKGKSNKTENPFSLQVNKTINNVDKPLS